jgi:(3S)-malyl-CoA thioesterase
MRPYRSVLYIPATRERALEKAQSLPCDAIIFDLEDAVAPDEKAAARAILGRVLAGTDFGPSARLVRINDLGSPWGADDARAMAGLTGHMEGLLIPKVSSAGDLDKVAALVPDIPLWAMMETPLAMLNAAEIAAHSRLAGMVIGTNDLAKDLRARSRPDRAPLMPGLGICLLAARAYDRIIIDGVFNAFRDDEGLRLECEQGCDMGFDGKSLIHPAQLAVANEVFAPSAADLDLALRQIEAYEAAVASGQAVAVVDGKIVENLHIVSARAVLKTAALIAQIKREGV